MASNAVIGALRVVLGADTAALEKGLKDAHGSLSKFSANVRAAGVAMGAALGVALGGVALAVKNAIDEADKLGKLAQSVGVPVEELSRLKHAADLSGVSVEDLGKSMGILSRRLKDAASNAEGETAIAFRQLGIRAQNSNGTLKSSTQIMLEVAERFKNMSDGAAKTALAMQIFGRSGASMIPMLNAGAAGIKAMMLEADQLGIVITDKTAKAAEAFNDNLTRLGRVKDGIIIKLTAEMLPALERFSQFIIDGAKNSDLLKNISDGLSRALDGVMRSAILVYDNIDKIVKVFGVFVAAKIASVVVATGVAFVKFAAAVRATTLIMGAFSLVTSLGLRGIMLVAGALAIAAGTATAFQQSLDNMWERIKSAFPENAFEGIKKVLEGMGLNLRGLEMDLKGFNAGADNTKRKTNDLAVANENFKKKLDGFIDSQKKRQAGLEAELKTIGLSEGAHARLKTILEAEALAKANNVKLTAEMRAKIEETADRTGVLADALERTRERWDDFKGAVLQVRSSLENAFVDAITQAKSFKDIIKSLISDLARMAAQSAFRQLFGGQLAWTGAAGAAFNGSSGAGVGSGFLSGLGKLLGFKDGGSFQVGGSGGIDSQLVAFKASPNERVTITKPGQDLGGGKTPNMNITVHVEGANGDQHVIGLVQQGVSTALGEYDRALPDRVQRIEQEPRWR